MARLFPVPRLSGFSSVSVLYLETEPPFPPQIVPPFLVSITDEEKCCTAQKTRKTEKTKRGKSKKKEADASSPGPVLRSEVGFLEEGEEKERNVR